MPVIVADNAWHRLRAARLAGVPIYFGELLSEHAENALELGAYANLLAVTANDSYNALVCGHFAPELGRQKVFQLATGETAEPRRPSPTASGRTAFADDIQYEDLQRRWYQGWGFHASRITESFRLDDLRAALPEGAIPLLIIDQDNEVRILAAGRPMKPERGERVLWFGCKPLPERAPATGERAADKGAD